MPRPRARAPASVLAFALAGVLAGAGGTGCRAGEGARAQRSRFPRARAHEPRARSFDVLSYGIALELLPAERAIRAECRVRLAPLSSVERVDRVELDLVGLTVESVTDEEGRPLTFVHARGTLSIELAAPLRDARATELAVRYSGVPERGLWFAGTRADGTGPTLVFSHGQTEGSRGWFPCFDDPSERAAVELTVTMPAGWLAVASGERLEAREESGRRTERWSMDFPHPAYLTGLVAGELQVAESHAAGVPLFFLAEPQYEEWIAPTFEETDEILAFLADFTDVAYPFAKYSQAAVDNFPWGGMENISATTLTPLLLGDERNHRDQPPHHLVAHEAAHQWFGNLFTCADWAHLWLNEGFATYFTLLYVEHSRGVDEFRAEMRETQEAYLNQDVGQARRPTIWNVWKEPDDVFDTRAYQGGAARLHLLRFLVGDEAFRAGVRAYAAEHAGRGVVTADLVRAMERASGRDLTTFFEQWFARAGFPEFEFAWEWDAEEAELVLEVEQTQVGDFGTPLVFALPVDVEIRDVHGPRTVRVELDQRRERFTVPSPERPLYVSFDGHGWIPKRVHEVKPSAEWLALARHAEDVNARREAVLVLGRLAGSAREREEDAPAEIEELRRRLGTDASAWVRADAATALGLARGDAARRALGEAALGDDHARVRTAALHALRSFGPDEGLAGLAEDAFYAGASYQVMGAAAGLLCHAAPARAFEFLTAALEQQSPHDALAAQVLRRLAELPDARVPGELRRWAAEPSLAPTARAAAVEGLVTTGRDQLASSRFLAPFLAEPSFHLRRAAVFALVKFADVGARRALADYYPRARTAEERRAIETLLDRDS